VDVRKTAELARCGISSIRVRDTGLEDIPGAFNIRVDAKKDEPRGVAEVVARALGHPEEHIARLVREAQSLAERAFLRLLNRRAAKKQTSLTDSGFERKRKAAAPSTELQSVDDDEGPLTDEEDEYE
jgi:hypothetical protein